MKKMFLLGTILCIFLVFLAGCAHEESLTIIIYEIGEPTAIEQASMSEMVNGIERVEVVIYSPDVYGYDLELGAISFIAEPLGNVLQITQNNIITGTAQINVSVYTFNDNREISLFLFNYGADTENPIRYATLTPRRNNSVTFTHLTSAIEYRIGVIIDGNEPIELTISN